MAAFGRLEPVTKGSIGSVAAGYGRLKPTLSAQFEQGHKSEPFCLGHHFLVVLLKSSEHEYLPETLDIVTRLNLTKIRKVHGI